MEGRDALLERVARQISSNRDYSEKEISALLETLIDKTFPSNLGDYCSLRKALVVDGYLWRGSVPTLYRKQSDVAKPKPIKQVNHSSFDPITGEHEGRKYGTGGQACDCCPHCQGSRDWCPFMD